MANPVAGWYQDPSGDPTKLRWWDGTQWTDNYADAQPAQPVAQQPYQQTPYQTPLRSLCIRRLNMGKHRQSIRPIRPCA